MYKVLTLSMLWKTREFRQVMMALAMGPARSKVSKERSK